MSIPIKPIIDWRKIEVCSECADKISVEVLKAVTAQRRGENYNLDISRILCDDCWIHNTEVTKAIRFELPAEMIRRCDSGGGKRKKATS